MKEFKYVITDAEGLHARPAGMLVKEAAKYACRVSIEKSGKEVDAKRIMAVMGLAAKCGNEVIIRCDGEGEEEASTALEKFMQENV